MRSLNRVFQSVPIQTTLGIFLKLNLAKSGPHIQVWGDIILAFQRWEDVYNTLPAGTSKLSRYHNLRWRICSGLGQHGPIQFLYFPFWHPPAVETLSLLPPYFALPIRCRHRHRFSMCSCDRRARNVAGFSQVYADAVRYIP